VPTADIACPDLALGPVPLTAAAASRLVHSIERMENLNKSADMFEPLQSPPKRYWSVPTADIAWKDLALGPVPLTPVAGSRVVHSIETVENLNNSAEKNNAAHGPHARSGLTAIQHLCGDSACPNHLA
jgi:hypothetical protein